MKSFAIFGAAIYGATTISMSSPFLMANSSRHNTPKPVTKSAQTVAVKVASKPLTTTPPKPKMVTVNEGDSLTSVAEANSTTYSRLYDANTVITDPNLIYPG